MKLQNSIITLTITLFTMASETAFGMHTQSHYVEDQEITTIKKQEPLQPTTNPCDVTIPIPQITSPVQHNQLGEEATVTVLNALRKDYVYNVRDLTWSRWFFRKTANITECLGNALLYVGSGLSALTLPVKAFSSEENSQVILFLGTICFATHVAFIGIAKCAAREEGERQGQIKQLIADGEIKFTITNLQPTIVDDAGSIEANQLNALAHPTTTPCHTTPANTNTTPVQTTVVPVLSTRSMLETAIKDKITSVLKP